MSLLPGLTYSAPGVPLYGGGGGGSGSNIVASTITLSGAAPISATFPSGANDGFEVRGNGGGGSNVVVVGTIDQASAAGAEFGLRSLSTIAGVPTAIGRFEMNLIPSGNFASLNYTLNNSTLGALQYNNGTTTLDGQPISAGGVGNELILPGTVSTISLKPYGTVLNYGQAALAVNSYVPAAGTITPIGSFPTTPGHLYEVRCNPRWDTVPAGNPALGSWASLGVDATGAVPFVTIDCAQVSTLNQQYQQNITGTFIATAATTTVEALGSLANTVSTGVTFTTPNNVVWYRDLGVPVVGI